MTSNYALDLLGLKGLNNSNIYVPSEGTGKKLLSFNAKKLLNNEYIN